VEISQETDRHWQVGHKSSVSSTRALRDLLQRPCGPNSSPANARGTFTLVQRHRGPWTLMIHDLDLLLTPALRSPVRSVGSCRCHSFCRQHRRRANARLHFANGCSPRPPRAASVSRRSAACIYVIAEGYGPPRLPETPVEALCKSVEAMRAGAEWTRANSDAAGLGQFMRVVARTFGNANWIAMKAISSRGTKTFIDASAKPAQQARASAAPTVSKRPLATRVLETMRNTPGRATPPAPAAPLIAGWRLRDVFFL